MNIIRIMKDGHTIKNKMPDLQDNYNHQLLKTIDFPVSRKV